MTVEQISALARHLFETQGPKALAEAAQKAAEAEAAGDKEQAHTWQRVHTALQEMRGPNQS